MTNMSADDSVPVGVIGLGMMGRPMAVNILNSGAGPVHITGRSRDRYSDLVAAGASGMTLLGRSPARPGSSS